MINQFISIARKHNTVSDNFIKTVYEYMKYNTFSDKILIANQWIIFREFEKNHFTLTNSIVNQLKDVVDQFIPKLNLKMISKLSHEDLNLLSYILENTLKDEALGLFNVEKLDDKQLLRLLDMFSRIDSPLINELMVSHAPQGFIYIKPGWHTMGGGFNPDNREKWQCWNKGFYVSRFPVSTESYSQKTIVSQKGEMPLTGVSWFEAYNFSKDLKCRLLTESEWEKAASGCQGTIYPWGNDFRSDNCNSFESNIMKIKNIGDSTNNVSVYGVRDMVGNAWEWTGSKYEPYTVGQGKSLLSTESLGDRVLRGGAYDFDKNVSNTKHRYACNPMNSWDTHGMRLAWSPDIEEYPYE